jgi:hypothetical protein
MNDALTDLDKAVIEALGRITPGAVRPLSMKRRHAW